MNSAPSRRGRWLACTVIVTAILLAISRWILLPFAGTFLVHADLPVKADVAVVLAGDQWGNRIVRGGQLVRDGFVPKVLVSGGPWVYGLYESDLAIRFAANQGYPASGFEALHEEVHSTQEEAHSIALELKRRNVRRVLVVTSDFHTRRAGRIWRHIAPWLDIRMIAAGDRYFRAGAWWRDREAGKHVFTEWSKLTAFTFDFFPPPNSGPVLLQ